MPSPLSLWASLAHDPATPVNLIRYGPWRDGGYVVPDLPYTRCLTIGVGGCIGFETDLAYHCGVAFDLFDHTISQAPALDRSTFHRLGLGRGTDKRMLAGLIGRCRQSPAPGPSLLKIDCEGGEWEGGIPAADLAAFDVIVIELHGLNHLGRYARYQRVIDALLRAHAIVNLHPNNHAPTFTLGALRLPSVLEVTLLARGYQSTRHAELNWPNNPAAPEIRLPALRQP